MPRPRAFAAIVTLSLAVLPAACGGSHAGSSHRVSAQSYVKSLCTAVLPFERSLLAHSVLLNSASPDNPAKSKQALQSFFAAVSNDTTTAVTRLRQAGTPDVKNGQRISTAVEAAFGQLQSAMSRAAQQANSLSTKNKAAFRSGAAGLSSSLRTSMNAIGSSLQSTALRSPALRQAASRSPACKAGTSGA